MAKKDNQMMYIAIVAIVAIVAIFVLIQGQTETAGQAGMKAAKTIKESDCRVATQFSQNPAPNNANVQMTLNYVSGSCQPGDIVAVAVACSNIIMVASQNVAAVTNLCRGFNMGIGDKIAFTVQSGDGINIGTGDFSFSLGSAPITNVNPGEIEVNPGLLS